MADDVANRLREAIAGMPEEEIRRLLEELHPADIAEALPQLEQSEQILVIGLLSEEEAAEVLMDLSSEDQSRLLEAAGPDRASAILSEMSADDIVDLVGDLAQADADGLIGLLEREAGDAVRQLLGYPEDTAGGVMTTEFVAVREDMTAGDAVSHLRDQAPDAETIYYVYVVDNRGRLSGVLSLRELIVADTGTPLKDIMETNVISVLATTDQEEVAQTVAKYDLLAVPVVDEAGTLLGIVTVDDVIDVIEEETTEDIHRFGGTLEVEEPVASALNRVKKRLPWLVVLLFGSMFSASVLRHFTATLETVVVLAYFIPVLIGMDGNVAIQSLATAVRGLSTGEVRPREIWGILGREAAVGLMLGVICGGLVTAVAFFWQKSLLIGAVVGVSMTVTMMVGALIGTLIPFVFDHLGVDAAVASGPFITTLSDITGLLIYFSLATGILGLLPR